MEESAFVFKAQIRFRPLTAKLVRNCGATTQARKLSQFAIGRPRGRTRRKKKRRTGFPIRRLPFQPRSGN
jgi:hypothetical protein